MRTTSADKRAASWTNAGRMLYVIVNRDQGYATLPIRAIEDVTAREQLQT